MNKEGEGEIGLVFMVVLIVVIIITSIIMSYNFQGVRDDFCINKGFNKSTDVSDSDDRYVKSWDIECDNYVIFWDVRDHTSCVKYDKFNDCVKKKRVLSGGNSNALNFRLI